MKKWELFAQVVKRSGQGTVTIPSQDDVMKSVELVVDDQGQLRTVKRVPGENDVSHWCAPPSPPHTHTQ